MNRIVSNSYHRRFHRMRGSLPSILLCAFFTLVSAAGALYLTFLLGSAADLLSAADPQNPDTFRLLLIRMTASLSISALARWAAAALGGRIACKIETRLRGEAVSALFRLPSETFDGFSCADLVEWILTDTNAFAVSGVNASMQLLYALLFLSVSLSFMIRTSFGASIVALLGVPFLLLAAYREVRRRPEILKRASAAAGAYVESVRAMVSAKKNAVAFGYSRDAAGTYDRLCMPKNDVSSRIIRCASSDDSLTCFIGFVILICAASAAALSAVVGGIGLGELIPFIAFSYICTETLRRFPEVLTMARTASAASQRISGILDIPSVPSDSEAGTTPKAVSGHIEFRGVSFRSASGIRILQRFSLNIDPGKQTGIVDPDGHVGSAISDLLLCLCKPDRGRILLDGVSITGIRRSSLSDSVFCIPSDPWILHATVRENIALSRPDADESDILEAAEAAHADVFIRRLPKGYDTMLDDDASESLRLSIALARAFLCPKPVVIIENADALLELHPQMRSSISQFSKGRTVIRCARNPAALRDCDVILGFEGESELEVGSYAVRIP